MLKTALILKIGIVDFYPYRQSDSACEGLDKKQNLYYEEKARW
jgi:hypothetical protein